MSIDLRSIPIVDISASPTNPRRTFDDAYIDELADDIKARGVLSPVLVRPHPIDGFELVFGECRWRAAQKAGLEVIPAMVRALSDAEVLEIQIIENAKRRDVHPLEEADAYRALHEQHEYSIDDIAAKLGKSKSYVYQRIRLCALAPTVREMFFAGRIKPAVALMLARIEDPETQAQAAEDVEHRPWSNKELWEHVQHVHLRQLAKAPFDIDDEDLVADAGSCAKCPHRTGNQRSLFDEVGDLDSCTKPACWNAKCDAEWERKSKGAKVLSEEEHKKVISYGGVAWGAPYVDLNSRPYASDVETWREALKDTEYEVVLARTDSGKILELVSKDIAEAALEKLERAPQPKTPEQKRKAKEAEERREKEEAERKAKEEARDARMASIVERVEKAGAYSTLLRAVIRCIAPSYYCDEARRRRGLETDAAFLAELTAMNDSELLGLIVEIAIEHGNDVCDEDPFAIVETALESAPKGRRALKKKEAAS